MTCKLEGKEISDSDPSLTEEGLRRRIDDRLMWDYLRGLSVKWTIASGTSWSRCGESAGHGMDMKNFDLERTCSSVITR